MESFFVQATRGRPYIMIESPDGSRLLHLGSFSSFLLTKRAVSCCFVKIVGGGRKDGLFDFAR